MKRFSRTETLLPPCAMDSNEGRAAVLLVVALQFHGGDSQEETQYVGGGIGHYRDNSRF